MFLRWRTLRFTIGCSARYISDFSCTIKHIQERDIDILERELKAQNRVIGTASELRTWHTIDPEGILVARSPTGEIAGWVCGIILSKSHGNLGMAFVKKQHRSSGLGCHLLKTAVDHLAGRNYGMVIYKELIPFISQCLNANTISPIFFFGFRLKIKDHAEFHKFESSEDIELVPLDNEDLLNRVTEYDRGIHIYDRSKIIKLTATESKTVCLVALQDSKVIGYGCVKPFLSGEWFVVPLYANNESAARVLIRGLVSRVPPDDRKKGVRFQVPSSNRDCMDLLREIGDIEQTYKGYRVFYKTCIDPNMSKVFCFQSGSFCSE